MKKKLINHAWPEQGRLKKFLLIMRLTTFLCLTFICSLNASVYSQSTKLGLELKGKTIRDAFELIENNSKFRFFYNADFKDINRKIDFSTKDSDIESMLNGLFTGSDISYEIVGGNLIVLKVNSQQTDLIVKGKVVDKNGIALPGVTIVVKGTTRGTVTNADGEYSLSNVPEDAILQFSFVGMKTVEIPVAGKSDIDVILEDMSIGINEVVAIGYGTMKKANITGAQTGVKAENLEGRAVTTLQEALAGKMAGVVVQNVNGMPGQETTMRIRGQNSLGADTDPLYVVDGITMTSITDVNLQDVESIEVIKDAASAAIYGARGANGVILITTKSGKKGTSKISVDISTGFQEPERLYKTMTPKEFYEYQNWYWDTWYVMNGGSLDTAWEDRSSSYRVPTYCHELDPDNLPDVDWSDAFYRTGLIQDYSISASGSKEGVRYYLSARYADQDYIMLATDYQSINLMAKIDVDLKNWLHAGINLSPSYITTHGTSNIEGNSSAQYCVVYIPPYTRLDQNVYEEDATWTYSVVNPVLRKKGETDETQRTNNNASLYTQIDILKNLSLKTTFGYNSRANNNQYYLPAKFNNYESYGTYSTGYLKKKQLENLLTFDSNITEKDKLNIILGQSCEDYYYLSSYQVQRDFPTDKITTLNAGTIDDDNYTTISQSRIASYFGRILYNYNEKYLLTLTGRYDGSSKFGSDNKWGFFPSASVGWKITEEDFMKKVSWVDLLKLRISYGISGNDQIGDFEWLSTLTASNYTLGDEVEAGYEEALSANSELSWERMRTLNIGLDFNVLDNRIQLSANYYRNDNDRSLMEVSLPAQSGFEEYMDNVGEIVNKGFELELFGRISERQVGWTTSLNFSTNSNEIVKLGAAYNFDKNGVYARNEEGHALNEWYIYKVDGLITQQDINNGIPMRSDGMVGSLKYLDISKDGEIDGDDRDWAGRPTPKYFYGITNNFSYKNFSLSVFFQGVRGGYRMENSARAYDYGGTGVVGQLSNWAHGYRSEDSPGDGRTPLPNRFSSILNWSTYHLYKSDYIKLKSVSLGYTIPKSILKSLRVAEAKISLTGDNLYTWFGDKNFKGINAEGGSSSYGDSNSLYMDYTTSPLARKVKIGINLTF